jgi:uncharacterized membrane protein (UPF0127 family)
MTQQSSGRLVSVATETDAIMAQRVRIASSFLTRCVGLLGRAQVEVEEGMLFRPGGSVHTVGMRTRIDVAFLDRDYQVLGTRNAIGPWRLAFAPRRTRYTLELAAGQLERFGVAVGQHLQIFDVSRTAA